MKAAYRPGKAVKIIESCTSNNNKRTVLQTVLQPHETVFAHYHTKFSETFSLVSGNITVYRNPTAHDFNESALAGCTHTLASGESATVPPNVLHKYLVGSQETTIRLTFEPGNLNFERAMRILAGAQRDGIYKPFVGSGEGSEEGLVFKAVIANLTDANCVGDEKALLDRVLLQKGSLMKATEEKLLAAYAGE